MNRYEERRKKLQIIFQDTLECIEKNDELNKATEIMVLSTTVYSKEIKVPRKCNNSLKSEILVLEDTTFSCAKKYVGSGKVAVLNFANPVQPGGGVVRGGLAQEESLCRSSNLYLGLTSDQMMGDYYTKNSSNNDSSGSDIVGYHPAVTVFKDDAVFAEYLPHDEWFQVDVITCAAPRITESHQIKEDQLYQIHVNRGRRILQSAIVNNAEIVVLGAFGCGDFRNDPVVVAKAYRYLLLEEGYSRYFRKVIFAIKKDHNDIKGNFYQFKNVFS